MIDYDKIKIMVSDDITNKVVNVINNYMTNKTKTLINEIYDHYEESIITATEEEIYHYIVSLENNNVREE